MVAQPVAAQGVPLHEAQLVATKQAIERVAVESRITPGAPVCRRFGHRIGAGAERWQSHRS